MIRLTGEEMEKAAQIDFPDIVFGERSRILNRAICDAQIAKIKEKVEGIKIPYAPDDTCDCRQCEPFEVYNLAIQEVLNILEGK